MSENEVMPGQTTTLENSATEFYDDFVERQVAGYVKGNPRIEAAVRHAIRRIPEGARRVLDIGCGIGNGTWEIKRNLPEAYVLGVDYSPRSIATANRLFTAPSLAYAHHDISQWNPLFDTPFDAVVMMDVYEHILPEQRTAVNAVLARALGPNGALILTVPSSLHQAYLRAREPEGLQPVDEDITFDVVSQLAHDIGGEVMQFSHVDIWRTADYVHVAIQRNPPFVWKEQASTRKIVAPESKAHREKRAATISRGSDAELGVGGSGSGATAIALDGSADDTEGLLKHGTAIQGYGSGTQTTPRIRSTPNTPRVCVIHPNRDAYSETFIRAHIERLPTDVTSLYGAFFPTHAHDGAPLLSRVLRTAALGEKRLPGAARRVVKDLQNKRLARYLTENKIGVVLAEYGQTGVAVMEACRAAGVPFAVHFHGFDAYSEPILDEYAAGYQRLFREAAAIIAVSRHMEEKLRALGAPRERLHYVPCGADAELFAGADPAVAPPHFVAVGRFTDKKAPQLTLLAFAQVCKEHPDARLTMIGDGDLWEACKQMAAALGLGESVQFPGPLSHVETAAVMRGARAFVQHSVTHSRGDSEGTPVAVMEAGATGLPVVATRHGGIVDVVAHEETGLLIDERDVDGMAHHMARLAAEPALAGALGLAARKRICEQFSLEKSIDRLWSVLSEAAG